ncbi:MAG: hypothetical protein ACI37N_07760 [Prevotella sp.]
MAKSKVVILLLAFTAIAVTSCQEKIKTTRGIVRNVSDTTTVVKVDKYDIVFDTKQARFDNGAIMQEDSVTVHYIGDLRDKKAKALLVRLMPKKGTVVEAVYDPSKELIVSDEPMSEEQIKRLEKYAKSK